MKSKRIVGLGLVCVALVASAAWLMRDYCPNCAATANRPTDRHEAEASKEDRAATAEMTESKAADEGADGDESAKVDFSGTWQLDVEASDSGDPIFTAIGMSFVQRALVNNAVVTHIIRQTADELTLDIQATGFSRTDHMTLNGEPVETADPNGRPVQSSTSWSDNGKELITKVWVKSPVEQHFSLTRSLKNAGGVMEVFVEFFPTDGETMSARRIYRRVQ